MKNINVVTKKKQRKLYVLESIEELKSLDFSSLIPSNAKQLELIYKDKDKLLKIDYILDLIVTKEE